MAYELKSARYLALDVWERALQAGGRAVDATMGNGHDTLCLARLAGETGHVDAFDIQAAAVASTRGRLLSAGVLDRCSLHHTGHERMAEIVIMPVDVVAFNLGWLPGGDKAVTTRLETTLCAVASGLALLKKGGVMTLCVYPGHPEGEREREKLLQYISALKPQAFNALHQRFANAGAGAPECIVIQK